MHEVEGPKGYIATPGFYGTPTKVLRPLSSYERLIKAIDEAVGFNFSVAFTFSGAIEEKRWNQAFVELQQRHPLLNAWIENGEPQSPAFVRGECRKVAIQFAQRNSPAQWQRVTESQLAEPFDRSIAPLLRVNLLHDNDGFDLILTANHIVLDGMGMIRLVRDLLAVLSGEKLTSLPIPVPADELVVSKRSLQDTLADSPRASEEALRELAALRPGTIRRREGGGAPVMDAMRFTEEETALLMSCARKEQATMGSVLLAAIVRAMQIVPGPLENARIRFAAPIDMRPDLGNANDFVLSMAMARGASPPLELGLWESARWIGARLRSFRSLIEFEAAFQGVEQLLSMNLPSAATVDALAARGGHDVMLSNLGSIDLPQAAAEGISLQAVWGPSVLVGYEGEHTVGSATWNGALHLVYTSHSPLRRLLEGARRVLMEGCTAGAKA